MSTYGERVARLLDAAIELEYAHRHPSDEIANPGDPEPASAWELAYGDLLDAVRALGEER